MEANNMILSPPEYTKPAYGEHPQNDCNKCQPITFDTIEEQMKWQQKFIEKVLKELEESNDSKRSNVYIDTCKITSMQR